MKNILICLVGLRVSVKYECMRNCDAVVVGTRIWNWSTEFWSFLTSSASLVWNFSGSVNDFVSLIQSMIWIQILSSWSLTYHIFLLSAYKSTNVSHLLKTHRLLNRIFSQKFMSNTNFLFCRLIAARLVVMFFLHFLLSDKFERRADNQALTTFPVK